ncbi:MAG: hypothetical protein AAB358_00255 [Patescibacteria group bacterium]
MKGTKIGERLKVEVSPKVAVGVILVVIGAALGAVAFNGLVPAIFAPSGSSSATAAPTGSTTGWTYAYGPNKNTPTDLANLYRTVINGSDVKIINIQAGLFGGDPLLGVACEHVSVNTVFSNTVISCFSQKIPHYLNDFLDEETSFQISASANGAETSCNTITTNWGSEGTVRGVCDASRLKWYIKN